VRGLGFPSRVILRPVFFMENLVSPWFLNGGKLYSALGPETRLQMIAVRDIGVYAARAFTEAERALSAGLGQPIEYVRIPMAEVRKNSEDFEWFERVGYDADIAGLEREFGTRSTKLGEWAALQRDAVPA
jgi:uncharacterized protein YbjT (DUF2867 family)